jgi:hypothetical protein
MIREILEEPASKKIWSDALNKEYGRWKKKKEEEEDPSDEGAAAPQADKT